MHTASTQQELDRAQAELDGAAPSLSNRGGKALVATAPTTERAKWEEGQTAYISRLAA